MSQAQPEIKQDDVQIEGDFSAGMTRDVSRGSIPDGGLYDSIDYMLEQPGRAYKRGGWATHSAVLPAPPSAVFSIHIPTRVGAIANNNLYDVTSESGPQATLIGSVGFSPSENPPTYINRVILCDPAMANRPKKVYTVGAMGTMTLDNLDNSPPYAAHSAVYASRMVLGRGNPDTPSTGVPTNPNRIWFSQLPGDTETAIVDGWDVVNSYIDTTYDVTGLAAIQSRLLIFSPRFVEIIVGGVPPGVEGENMELQPVGGVGCIDARSIVVVDNQVMFASEEGAYLTNGVGFDNLMEKSDRSGILSYWRSLFARFEIRVVVGGMLMRDYYLLSSRIVTDVDERRENFVCYLPTKSWWRTSNTHSNMFAIGATEQENVETYAALAHENYVARMTPLLRPEWSNRYDGNGLPVEPVLEPRVFGTGPGLKAYGFGRITRDLQVPDSVVEVFWQPSHAYALNDLVYVNETVWRATAAGTSAAFQPDWLLADDVDETIVDGTVTWKNEGPRTQIFQATGLEAEEYVQTSEGDFGPTPKAERTRFSLFRDSQALSLKIAQQGPSEQTELFLVEVEHRSYELAADGN